MPPERRSAIIFAVVVIALLGLIGVILGTSRARAFEYTIMFEDAGGIQKGDAVQLSGVDIGRVRSVDLDRTGESINVVVEIDKDHRNKVRANSTALIRDADTPNVSGQKVIEIFNSSLPSPPLPRRAVVIGKNSAAEVTAWQFKDQVENWSEQLRGVVEELSEAAKSGYEKGRENLDRIKREQMEEQRRREKARAEESPTPEPSPPAGGEDGEAPAAVAPDSATDGTTALRSQQQGMEGARELLREFKDSEEYRRLVERTIDILQRLSDNGTPSALAQIVLDWKELKKELGAAIQVLREAGRLALAEQLDTLAGVVEEMIRARQQQLGQPEGSPAPPDAAPAPAPGEDTIEI